MGRVLQRTGRLDHRWPTSARPTADREPFGIRYWGVGNESWGCGGKFIPEDYCREYRQFTEWLPEYGVPLYLIAAGPNSNDLDWTRRFFAKWADGARADSRLGAALLLRNDRPCPKFSHDQWYEQLHKANQMETLINDQWAALGEFDREHAIKLVVDEWGSWHPAGTEINKRHLFEQMGTLRDALVAALSLDTFNRHADKVDMANVAQLVNNLHSLFLADGDKFVATPTFHVYTMYRPHQGAKAVRIDVQAPDVTFRAGGQRRADLPAGGLGLANGRTTATLTLAHTHATEPAEVVDPAQGGAHGEVRHTVLTHAQLNAHNTFEQPETVVPSPAVHDPRASGEEIRCLLPPASVNRLDIKLA